MTWVPFVELSRRAMVGTYATFGLDGDSVADTAWLLDSVRAWPMWPDVMTGLGSMAGRYRVGVLSNVDDDIFRTTQVARHMTDDLVFTSERLGCYKPSPEFYRRADERVIGRLVHVASSARDVRGALEAGITVVRLRRKGHDLDPRGPRPTREVGSPAELQLVVDNLFR